MNTICALCGTPLTSTDMLVGKNKLADGGYLCAECFNKAITVNRDLINNLDQFYFAEITGMILKSKIDASQNPGSSAYAGSNNFEYDAPTRLDEIKDQIVALNARLSVLANEEVNELDKVLDGDEKLVAIAECIDLHSNREGIIFSTQRRVIFMDKKFLGGVIKREFTHQDITSIEQVENLLYSVLKINTRGGVAEFKLHNKSDGRVFCTIGKGYFNEPEKQMSQQPRQPQSLYQSTLTPSSQGSSNTPKESPEVIFEQLEKLGKLKEMGILSEEEFSSQKAKLLQRL
ncbi:SHOCT domain-containing protein [Chryseobacterium sp. G0186]|uniref:SHOCT domain-containing protein n=1 Tax=Chryseobacterium sp. G0186 TaxID=2487064 RepID=UPI0013DDA858|nr:SHOCT domain-containing protein [Chryseobacterium sp. G0186]